MEPPQLRRVFNDKEGIMLLRQVSADRPFQAKKGAVMKAWVSIANQLAGHEDFGRPSFDAKKALNRFGASLRRHGNREVGQCVGLGHSIKVVPNV
ncbi:hypothetical protein H257_08495 [Aphanomyces astaci]|uniref:Uncharacterized protein n=1 Tax=Aphanomyces astaci TaxID=112090 RepID=W4GD41_APHAT|nr:hypothetical protein H257_08495 [Aphanomyces astaci]ETV77570.1 hypothetical protein H257_08495 [Aphanomyces astaci]|eukprot:XP_009832680.1 hypothetical protein H257_08495 [Aphanomyces astaci]